MNASSDKLLQREKLGNLRSLDLRSHLIDFASNDFLGLARAPELSRMVSREWKKNLSGHLGSSGSRLLTGNSLYAENLEKQIAAFHGYEAGLLFSSGYMANLGLLSSAAHREDLIFYDSQIHASTQDGIRLSGARAFPFRHNDSSHLEERLRKIRSHGKTLVCIESVYSVDGSQAPLLSIANLVQKHDAFLIVDEAHAVGLYGPQGRGLVAEAQCANQIFAQVTTFGKALGVFGAIVLGSCTLKSMLLNFARPCIYSTALPSPLLAAIRCSYQRLPHLENERQHLQRLIQHFRSLLPSRSSSQIQTISIPGNYRIRHISQQLAQVGFDVRPLLSPTVRRGQEVLRLCLHSFNTKEEISLLLQQLENYV